MVLSKAKDYEGSCREGIYDTGGFAAISVIGCIVTLYSLTSGASPAPDPLMQEKSLRVVLLVKAIEEADRAGTLIPAAERVTASREARRSLPAAGGGSEPANTITPAAERLLVARAETLRDRIVGRHPFVRAVLDAAGGARWIGALLLLLGAVCGVALSALDGSQRINIIAPGLIGLVLWNLGVYLWLLWLLWRTMAGRTSTKRPARPLPSAIAQNGVSAMLRLIGRSAAFNAPLAAALRQFGREWTDAARGLLVARATRVIHLAAAAAGIGLIAGLYMRGIALEYQAGWESTFLDAPQVRTLLSILYGPASMITGIALPDAAHLEAIRWRDSAGGERATQWMHLLAATAALYVVVPRLLLAVGSTLVILRRARRAALPASLAAYYRRVFSAVDSSIGRGIVMVAPYAYEPLPASLAQMKTLLPAAFGDNLALDLRPPIAYGDEESFIHHLGDRGGAIADIVVLLFNLAATPEEENHGALIAGVRDWIAANSAHAQMLVLLDEAPYASRMGAQSANRVDERRRTWQTFAEARGLSACAIDLSVQRPTAEDAAPSVTELRRALWQPT